MLIKPKFWVNNGFTLGFHDDQTYFILGGVPGESVQVKPLQSKKNFCIVETVNTPSNFRIPSDCPVFLKCGGCSFRHIPYTEELLIKQELVKRELKLEFLPPVHSSSSEKYRNNVQLHFDGKESGFFAYGSNEIVRIPEAGCKNLSAEMNEFIKKNIPSKKNKIFLREMDEGIIDYSEKSGKITIQEKTFALKKNAFLQINKFLMKNWIERIVNLIPKKIQSLTEFYCGSGILSIFIADKGFSLTGFELDSHAVEAARSNAKQNRIQSIEFIRADLENKFTYKNKLSKEAWIFNPPRKGLSRKFLESVKEYFPEFILYSSCNYTTLARDLAYFKEHGYKVKEIEIFDFFPRTPYVETLAVLER